MVAMQPISTCLRLVPNLFLKEGMQERHILTWVAFRESEGDILSALPTNMDIVFYGVGVFTLVNSKDNLTVCTV